MPEIAKVNAWGSAINNWTKIIVSLFVVVGFCFLTYYKILSNTEGIKSIRIELDGEEKEHDKDFEIWGSRSDKRYKRALEKAEELTIKNKAQDEQILKLIERVTYLEGRNNCDH